ncbi:MAG: hypothetical protein ACI8TX_000957 [Hyphomicrobiaceae bacterium]|jgi:hypothetical protein
MPAFGSHKASTEIEIRLILVVAMTAQFYVFDFVLPALGERDFVMVLEVACRATPMPVVVFESATPDIAQPNCAAASRHARCAVACRERQGGHQSRYGH